MLIDEETNLLKAIKNAIIWPFVVALLNATDHVTLDIEARDVEVGCVLLQRQPEEPTNPIGYCYRTLKDTECEYVLTTLRKMIVFQMKDQR